jgi:hypothetical protein
VTAAPAVSAARRPLKQSPRAGGDCGAGCFCGLRLGVWVRERMDGVIVKLHLLERRGCPRPPLQDRSGHAPKSERSNLRGCPPATGPVVAGHQGRSSLLGQTPVQLVRDLWTNCRAVSGPGPRFGRQPVWRRGPGHSTNRLVPTLNPVDQALTDHSRTQMDPAGPGGDWSTTCWPIAPVVTVWLFLTTPRSP